MKEPKKKITKEILRAQNEDSETDCKGCKNKISWMDSYFGIKYCSPCTLKNKRNGN